MSPTGQQTPRTTNRATAKRPPPNDIRSGSSPPPQMPLPPRRSWLWFLAILLINYAVMRIFFAPGVDAITVPYTFFKAEAGKNNVKAIYSQGETITGKFVQPVTYPTGDEDSTSTPPKTASDFTTILPTFVDADLEEFLIEHNVEISAKPIAEGGGLLATLLLGFGPALFLIGFYVWMFRRAGQQGGMGGLMGIGRSKAKRYDLERDVKVSFEDVAGIDE